MKGKTITDNVREKTVEHEGRRENNLRREEELEHELRSFEKERENIRRIIGKLGGAPSNKARLINVIFVVLVLAVFGMSIVWGGRMRFFMMEVGILLLSIKLIFFLESHMRLNHFQFWILSSLEWRLDKIDRQIRTLLKDTKNDAQ